MAAPSPGQAAGVLGQAPKWATKALYPKMELSDIAQDKPALIVLVFVIFSGFISSIVLLFVSFFKFYFILKFIFTANVHVGIMFDIVTLIVITVFL